MRAHDFLLLSPGAPGAFAEGRLAHVVTHGATVRVELAAGDGRTLEAEMPRDAWEGLGLKVGDPVGIGIRRIAVF